MNVIINDNFKNYINDNYSDLHKYNLMNELLFYGIFVYYYYFGAIQEHTVTFMIIKYIILILVLRYVFNSITNITRQSTLPANTNESMVNYYQINSRLAIFIIMIIFLSNNKNPYEYSTMLLIISYIIFISAISHETTTVDNILTAIITLYIYSLHLIN